MWLIEHRNPGLDRGHDGLLGHNIRSGRGGGSRAQLMQRNKSLVAPYAGGVAVTKSLGPPPHGVSCEFANAGATKIVIVNVGQGTAASFAVLRTTSAQGGRTVAPITGLGSSAFSISNAGRPGGVAVLSAQGVVFAVTANLPFAKDEALIKQLMARY